MHQPDKISTCTRPKSQQWVCNIFKILLTAENYKPHTQSHPKKMISAKKIFTKSQKGYLMPWAKWKTHKVSSYIILAVAKGQSQMQNRNFKTAREVSSHIFPSRKVQSQTQNCNFCQKLIISTYANFPPHDMIWWCYVNVSLCGMHACVCENVYVIMVNTVMSVSKPA